MPKREINEQEVVAIRAQLDKAEAGLDVRRKRVAELNERLAKELCEYEIGTILEDSNGVRVRVIGFRRWRSIVRLTGRRVLKNGSEGGQTVIKGYRQWKMIE